MTTTGFVLIFFARAAYRRLLVDSEMLDRAGEMQVIYKNGQNWGLYYKTFYGRNLLIFVIS
jgi:hypothetical protein